MYRMKYAHYVCCRCLNFAAPMRRWYALSFSSEDDVIRAYHRASYDW